MITKKKKKSQNKPSNEINKIPKFTHMAVFVPGNMTVIELAEMAYAVKCNAGIETEDAGARIILKRRTLNLPAGNPNE